MLIFIDLLVDLILGFVTAISHKKPADSNSQSTIILVLQDNRLTNCASHPKIIDLPYIVIVELKYRFVLHEKILN